MSHDARALLQANAAAIERALESELAPQALVVTVATWGRGCRQEAVRALQRYSVANGHSGSLVAVPPREVAAEILGLPELMQSAPAQKDMVLVVAVGFGRHYTEWRARGRSRSEDELF